MLAKNIHCFCFLTLFIQTITAQCLRNSQAYPAAPLINDLVTMAGACGTGLPTSNGGSLSVTSASPIAPTGLVVTSENAIEGPVAVGGQLPLLGSVAMDAAFSSAGAGAISYACGDGSLGIVNEAPIFTTSAIASAVPTITAAAVTPTIASSSPSFTSSGLGSSFRFGPGKSPFSGSPLSGQPSFGTKGPTGRGCGFRY